MQPSTTEIQLSILPEPGSEAFISSDANQWAGYIKPELVKFDSGKRNWALLPYDSLEEIVKVLEFGARKYEEHNWKRGGGFKYSRTFNAIMRHMTAVMFFGEDNDPESGLSHWAHVGCNVLFILHYVLNKDKYNTCDDRTN